jgi:glycosyltransferase involved in cell wall biosynthesis
MYKGKTVSVVLPTYNEEDSIRSVIDGFFATGVVDEIVAVDNRSTDRSAEEIYATKAKYVLEQKQGYGAALMRGLREASGDILIAVEPDGTFWPNDIMKFLSYGEDFSVVFGSRTSRSLIWSGANMDFSLRMGNWAVAKLLEYLFNGPSMTDVGCTYKLIHRSAYERIAPTLSVTGSHFSPEFMIRALAAKLSAVEIPVHYGKRSGTSKITGKKGKAILLGFRMISFILSQRIRYWLV